MTDPQAEAVAALWLAFPVLSENACAAGLTAIQQDPSARAALVAVLAPPSPEPLDVERPPEELEAEAGRLLVASARARKARMGPSDAHELRHLLACLEAGNSDPCNGGTACTLDAALANTEPAPEGEPHPDPLWRAALANTEAYVRGHWDGLHCDAKGFGGILDECEHVGRIYEPRAATPPSPAPEGERTLDAAWADLRAVLPDEWIVILYDSGPPTTYNPGPESPFHGPRYLARADIGIRSGPPRISAQSDESPAAALDALRAALLHRDLAELLGHQGRGSAREPGPLRVPDGPSQRAGSGGVRSDALARRRGSRDRRSRMRIVWGDEVPGARELPAGHRLCFYGLTFGWLGIGVIRSVKRPSKARRGDE